MYSTLDTEETETSEDAPRGEPCHVSDLIRICGLHPEKSSKIPQEEKKGNAEPMVVAKRGIQSSSRVSGEKGQALLATTRRKRHNGERKRRRKKKKAHSMAGSQNSSKLKKSQVLAKTKPSTQMQIRDSSQAGWKGRAGYGRVRQGRPLLLIEAAHEPTPLAALLPELKDAQPLPHIARLALPAADGRIRIVVLLARQRPAELRAPPPPPPTTTTQGSGAFVAARQRAFDDPLAVLPIAYAGTAIDPGFDRGVGGAAVAPEEAQPIGVVVLAAAVAAGSRLRVAVDVVVAVGLRDRWRGRVLLLGGQVFLAASEEAEAGAPTLAELDRLHDRDFFSGSNAAGLDAGE